MRPLPQTRSCPSSNARASLTGHISHVHRLAVRTVLNSKLSPTNQPTPHNKKDSRFQNADLSQIEDRLPSLIRDLKIRSRIVHSRPAPALSFASLRPQQKPPESAR